MALAPSLALFLGFLRPKQLAGSALWWPLGHHLKKPQPGAPLCVWDLRGPFTQIPRDLWAAIEARTRARGWEEHGCSVFSFVFHLILSDCPLPAWWGR